MSAKIFDEFTDRKVSRQRKYQLRKKRDGLCHKCGQPTLLELGLCPKCVVHWRETQRAKAGAKARFFNCRSYQLTQ